MSKWAWRKGGWMMAVLFLVAFLAAGCSGQTAEDGQEKGAESTATAYPLQVTDDLGRQVTIAARPERIVSLAPSNTEVLFALGLNDQVVGVTDYCDYPAEATAKEKVGGFSDPNIEKVVSLAPDLVLATGGVQRDTVDQLAALGLTVFVLNPHTVDEALEDVRTVAGLAGVVADGEELYRSLTGRVQAVRDKVAALPESERPPVFHEVWPDPLMTAGPGSFADDMITLAGGRNVAADTAEPYPQFSLEALVDRDPAVIITPFAETVAALEKGQRPAWDGLRAVAAGRVYMVDQDLVSRSGPRLVEGLEAFAHAIHPDLFR